MKPLEKALSEEPMEEHNNEKEENLSATFFDNILVPIEPLDLVPISYDHTRERM